jgi:hypothetical protein
MTETASPEQGTTVPDPVRRGTSIAVAGVVTALVVVALVLGGDLGRTIVAVGTAFAVAGYITAFHPKVVLYALPIALGAAPFMHVPFTDIPMLLALSAMIWVAICFLPNIQVRLGWPEAVVAAIAAVALCSVVATGVTPRAALEWISWVVATAVLIPVRQLPTTLRTNVCRVFAVSASIGSALAIAIWVGLPRSVLRHLDVLGYDVVRNQRRVADERITTRLAGTFLEPNIAGVILLIALAAAVVFLSGRLRVVVVAVITVALLLTLSRSAFGTAIVAAVLVLLRSSERRRELVLWGGGAVVAALAFPSVRSRLADSLGPRDVGLSDRKEALASFPGLMEGHWIWGLGWARPEFRNAGLTQASNFVANGPLLTIYRGGLVVGIVIVLAALVIAFRAWVFADRSFAAAVVCCLLIALLFVAFQLDFPIVNQAPATAAVSLLIAMTLFVPDDRAEPPDA